MEEAKLKKRKRKAESQSNNKLLVSACTDLAALYIQQGKYEVAISEYTQMSAIHKLENNNIEYAKANRAIGEAYLALHKFESALKHHKIYLDVVLSEGCDSLEIQRAYATMGHTYLTWYLETQLDPDGNLNAAYKFFMKSLKIAESLKHISKLEKVDMMARLLANLGLVKESQGDYENAVDLISRSISYCKQHDIYEQLTRNYMSMASLYEKKAEKDEAISNYNLCIDTAKKLKDNIDLLCSALLAKSELLIKLSDFHGAKLVLLKAYKLHTPIASDRETVEKKLRVVASMCKTEDRLIVSSGDHQELKNLYEKMGDGACMLKNYTKAIEYYTLMLEHAEKSGVSDKDLGSCYYSLAETYKDNGDYIKAVYFFEKEYKLCKELGDGLNTLSKIADVKESANANLSEVKAVYEEAFQKCRFYDNSKEERRMVARYIQYLHRNKHHEESIKAQNYLNSLGKPENEDDSPLSSDQESDDEVKTPVGDEINLDDLTDNSEKSDGETAKFVSRKRSKRFTIKKNNKGETQLHTACISGNLQVARHLLDQGHPVNVRDNSGWLPLHEACNHGHLELVKLLVEKGAAVNDRGGTHCSGVTALYDAASNGHLEIVEYLLDNGASVVTKTDNGDTALNVLRQYHENNKFTGNDITLYNSLIKRISEAMEKAGQRIEDSNKTLRRNRSFVTDEDTVSKNFGLISTKKSSTAIENTNVTSKRSALTVDDEENWFSDWLVEDAPNKRRRTSSLSARTNSRSSGSFEAHTSPKKSISPQKQFDYEDFEDEQICMWVSNSPQTRTENRKKRQVSLLDTGFSKDRDRTSSQQSRKNWVAGTACKQQKQIKVTNFVRNISSTAQSFVSQQLTPPVSNSENIQSSQFSMVEPNLATEDDMRYVDVIVDNITFRIPVLSSQIRTKNIAWLAEQAAIKYERRQCKKPVLELLTVSGALLSEDDPLQLIFPKGVTQAETVVGKILRLNLPTLIDRYKEICSYSGVEVNEQLCTKLEEAFSSLDLNSNGFLSRSLTPLFKTVNHQSNLLELDLSGNFLDIECFRELCLSLPTLTNLTVLDLKRTGLTCNHLEQMDIFGKSSNPVLEHLSKLDLSDNPLKNKSLQCLGNITKHLKLTTFGLSNVKLVSPIWKSDATILHLRDLLSLDISYNEINKGDIHKFLVMLNLGKVTCLSIGSNLDADGIVGILANLLEIADSVNIKEVNFSRCNVRDTDLYLFLQLCSDRSLTKINLSYNNELTGISLRRLLESPTLQEIDLSGCNNVLRHFGECEDYNLLEYSADKKILKVSADATQYRTEIEALKRMFQKKYGNSYMEMEGNAMLISSMIL